MKHEVIVYSHPYSNLCVDCEHGEWMKSETFEMHCFICQIRCSLNDGLTCPYRVQSEVEKQEAEEPVIYSFFNH